MRTFSILRAIILAAAIAAPLAQAAVAQAAQQQAFGTGNALSMPSYGGPYDNSAVMAPAIGN